MLSSWSGYQKPQIQKHPAASLCVRLQPAGSLLELFNTAAPVSCDHFHHVCQLVPHHNQALVTLFAVAAVRGSSPAPRLGNGDLAAAAAMAQLGSKPGTPFEGELLPL